MLVLTRCRKNFEPSHLISARKLGRDLVWPDCWGRLVSERAALLVHVHYVFSWSKESLVEITLDVFHVFIFLIDFLGENFMRIFSSFMQCVLLIFIPLSTTLESEDLVLRSLESISGCFHGRSHRLGPDTSHSESTIITRDAQWTDNSLHFSNCVYCCYILTETPCFHADLQISPWVLIYSSVVAQVFLLLMKLQSPCNLWCLP